MRLDVASLAQLPASVQRPHYDQAAQRAGIVHFGIGAFHRAHQAVYTDDAMEAGDLHWRIIGVSLRSSSVAEQINPQQGLFSIAIRSDSSTTYRVIGAIQKVLVAPREPIEIINALANLDAHVVTFTVTEKGYCRTPDGNLDFSLADDASIYRFLAAGLALRRSQGAHGLTLLSCDNLAGNGRVLEKLLRQYLATNDPSLGEWVDRYCTFPSSMVDRIVPATTQADQEAASATLGVEDRAHVVTEPYSQWVIEDNFCGRRPRWNDHGAVYVTDVRPYETAKLRMLNGAHSALSYLGLLRGYNYVHEAIADQAIRGIVQQLMTDEAAPSVDTAPGQNLLAYSTALLERFSNKALNHRLQQIAMDGSQKIPQRWLDTLKFHSSRGQTCDAILTALAAWLLHVRGDEQVVDDPLASRLADAWVETGSSEILQRFFGDKGLVSTLWNPSKADVAKVRAVLSSLERNRNWENK